MTKKNEKTIDMATSSDKTAKDVKQSKYIEAVGRRKESIARVRFTNESPGLIINNKTLDQYFPLLTLQNKVLSPLKETNTENKFFISVHVKGGGMTGQAEAIRLGISRCLVKMDPNFKSILREKGFLTRDSRVVERKKYGLKKARRAPQWQKR